MTIPDFFSKVTNLYCTILKTKLFFYNNILGVPYGSACANLYLISVFNATHKLTKKCIQFRILRPKIMREPPLRD